MKPETLLRASYERKAIVGLLPTTKPIPAAFLVGMQFRYVMLRLSKAKIYKPKNK